MFCGHRDYGAQKKTKSFWYIDRPISRSIVDPSLIVVIIDPDPGPTSEWFFEDLTDLQWKLFSGASKKSGVPRNSQTARKTHQNPHLYHSVEDKDIEKIKSN